MWLLLFFANFFSVLHLVLPVGYSIFPFFFKPIDAFQLDVLQPEFVSLDLVFFFGSFFVKLSANASVVYLFFSYVYLVLLGFT